MSTEAAPRSRLDLSVRIGMVIRQQRIIQKMTQEHLAASAGITQSMLSMIENGRRNSRINLNALERVANALKKKGVSSIIQLAEAPDLDSVIRSGAKWLRTTTDRDMGD